MRKRHDFGEILRSFHVDVEKAGSLALWRETSVHVRNIKYVCKVLSVLG